MVIYGLTDFLSLGQDSLIGPELEIS